MNNAARLAQALEGKANGDGWIARCPAHDDRHASLSITEKNGKVLVHCHAGCSQDAVVNIFKRRGLWPTAKSKSGPKPHEIAEYIYRDADKRRRYRVVRMSDKAFPQFQWQDGDWISGMEGVERLPFHLPQLLETPLDETVFVPEGEKDVLSLEDIGVAASCNSGGALKWLPEISRWFQDRDVVLLPDNDDPGRKHVEDAARKLDGIASRIRILELPGLPAKGDVSDWIEAGGTRKELMRLADEVPDWQASAETPTSSGPVALGYTRDGRFILLDPVRQIIEGHSAGQLTQTAGLMALAPSEFWAARFPAGSKRQTLFDAWAAGEFLMNECRRAGPFNLLSIRGRGIWREGDEIVVNLGGPVPNPRYLCFEPIAIDASAEFDTERLLKLIRKFRWRHKRDAYLFLGWLAVAPICGVLQWRPHIWVHGAAKTGKTTLNSLSKATLSPLALSCDGGSSEAGIRQTIGPDSLPVIIDEFEGDQHHIKGVLRLARTASSAEDPLLRGTPEGRAMSFALRATFAFFAVNPLGMSVADESRIVMLELMKHDNDSGTARLIEEEVAHFRRQKGVWCSMMVSRAGLIPKAIERFERAIDSGNRRHRQNMATLLGGAFVARYGEVPNSDDIRDWSEFFAPTVETHAEEQDRDDGQECLDYLFAHMVRSRDWGDFPLRHWIATAVAERGDGLGEARRIVEINDMRIIWPEKGKEGDSGLFLKNGSAAIERVFTGSRWAEGGWKRALRQLDGAAAVGPMKFYTKSSGRAYRATRIPLDYVPSPIGSEDDDLRAAGRESSKKSETP
jgi:hypothetical protein